MVAEVIARRGEQLAGKVVVDITNPLNVETFDSLVVPADGSAAAEIAEALPQSRVVKAFNTNFAATLASGTVGDQPTTVLIAGDDADAKSLLAGIVTAGGCAPPTPAPCAALASWRRSASCRSPSRRRRRSPGTVGSPWSPDRCARRKHSAATRAGPKRVVMPVLVVVDGQPGSGKSTINKRLPRDRRRTCGSTGWSRRSSRTPR